MPTLGADMEDALLLEWRVAPGDAVARGAVACVVETQKGAIDVENWEAGTIARLLAQPGERIAVGTPIAVLAQEEEDWQSVAAEHEAKATVPPAAAASTDRAGAASVPPAAGPAARAAAAATRVPRSSPAARRRAAELGIDLQALAARSDGEIISLADVEAAASAGAAGGSAVEKAGAAAAEPAAGTSPPAEDSMRTAIAAAMSRSNREIPHYHVSAEIDIDAAWRRLEAYNRDRPIAQRVLFAALAMQAVAGALRDVPELNGRYVDGALHRATSVHVGVVTSLRGGGVVIPTVHDADRLSLSGWMEALREVVTRARQGRLRSSDLADSTITVTNLSDSGADDVHGLIYPPQVALVGLGRIAPRPVVGDDGEIVARRTIRVTLAGDHRASDGLAGARFLSALRERLGRAETTE
ncbi:MAG: dihydrolipoamide acetyltransferase family protein [Burkholderiaceae bacterium]|nr:dihydrolipoamide acetyltransferase family protein [Burkholderiaceae bacterium]